MQIAKYITEPGRTPEVGLVEGGNLRRLATGERSLTELLHDDRFLDRLNALSGQDAVRVPLESVRLLAPVDAHEVWGAGVTYERSKVAREDESEHGGSFYDLVYRASRPELFFKATPSRVVGPGEPIRVRRDTRWCVPEPELALVLSPSLRLVGFTIGNDVSAAESVTIRLVIERSGTTVFDGSTSVGRMARSLDELIDWLGRDNLFPHGVILLTGTGVVPPDDFTLQAGDLVRIIVEGIGTLANPVVQGPRPG
jgi:2-dehydro-3-deoxy-D-arabinonate dehydratase